MVVGTVEAGGPLICVLLRKEWEGMRAGSDGASGVCCVWEGGDS